MPPAGTYGVAFCFLPKEAKLKESCLAIIEKEIKSFNYTLLCIREVPTNNVSLGQSAIDTEPYMVQVFVVPDHIANRRAFEARLYLLRNKITRAIIKKYEALKEDFYIVSFSSQTIIYKGQLKAGQLRQYYADLSDVHFKSAIAMVHSRFSTNTLPKWKLAQPFRLIAHNGEINTIQGNLNWWKSREKSIQSDIYSNEEIQHLFPVCASTLSDSGNFDAVFEFIVRNGKSIPHTLMMMIPEAWQYNGENYASFRKNFYAYHENIMEAWDGPASMCFTDGIVLGATLDRNGLRPSRYCLTKRSPTHHCLRSRCLAH